MNEEKDELKLRMQELSLSSAKEILRDSGFAECDRFYSLRVYEMQFVIYNELKICFNLD